MDPPEKEHRSDDEAEYEDEEVDPRIQVSRSHSLAPKLISLLVFIVFFTVCPFKRVQPTVTLASREQSPSKMLLLNVQKDI